MLPLRSYPYSRPSKERPRDALERQNTKEEKLRLQEEKRKRKEEEKQELRRQLELERDTARESVLVLLDTPAEEPKDCTILNTIVSKLSGLSEDGSWMHGQLRQRGKTHFAAFLKIYTSMQLNLRKFAVLRSKFKISSFFQVKLPQYLQICAHFRHFSA